MLKSTGKDAKSTLFARWVVLNSLITALFTVGYVYGVLDRFLTDETYMTHGIIAIFGIFLVGSGLTSFFLQQDWKSLPEMRLKYASAIRMDRGNDWKEAFSEKLSQRLSLYKLVGPLLVGLGLLGTVIGISIAFSGINPDVIADVQASTGVMAVLLSGLATAFHTTLAGIVGMLWNMINLHMLTQESSRLYSNTVKG